jgi:hypothetical protein
MYTYIQYMHVCAENLYISSGFAQMIASCLQGVQVQGLATFEPTLPLDHRSAKRLMFHPRGPNFRLSCHALLWSATAASNGSVHTGMHFSSNTCACLKMGEPVVPCHPLVNHNCHS